MKHMTVKLKLFFLGLTASLLGSGLIALGDGSEILIRKGVVVSGVILVVGGIGILRYLLFSKNPGWGKSRHLAE